MTWEMYQRLYETCEEVDADDAVRVLVLKGAGGKAFVAGTDIGQFTEFKGGEDGLRYERDGDRRTGGSRAVTKPVIAQIRASRSAAASASPPAPTCASRRPTRASARRSRARSATACRCRPTRATSTCSGRRALKELIFTARLLTAEEALAAGFVHEIVAAEAIEARVRELAETVASHAPITLWVTKEAVRRIQEARTRAGRRRPRRHDLRQRRLPRRRARLHGEAPAALDGKLDRTKDPGMPVAAGDGRRWPLAAASAGGECASAHAGMPPRKAARRRPAGPRPVLEDACPW